MSVLERKRKGSRKFLKSLREEFGDTMFSYRDAKMVYYWKHWQDRERTPATTLGHPLQHVETEMSGGFLKASVQLSMDYFVATGELIKICPGWFMFPLEE